MERRHTAIFILVVSMAVAGCVPAELAPPNVRKLYEPVESNVASPNELFDRAQAWLARDHSETKITVSYLDRDHLRIVAKASMYCNASIGSGLRSAGLGLNVSRLAFNIDFQVRDGEASITYDELYYYLQDMRYEATKLVQGPSNAAQVSTLYKECILPLHEDFVAHLHVSGG